MPAGVLGLVMTCRPTPRTSEPVSAPPRSVATASQASVAPAPPRDCGELALQRVELVAEGKGEAHPMRVAVERELAACSEPRPSDTACARVIQHLHEQERAGLGPRHPEIVTLNAKRELCRATFGPAGVPAPTPPTPEECAALPADRERLLGEGKGERHPTVLAIDARMVECRRGK